MGYLTAKNDFHAGLLGGDESKYKTYAIEFGGGARFWFDNHFSFSPTLMGMYERLDYWDRYRLHILA